MSRAAFLRHKVTLILKNADPEQLAGPSRDQMVPRYERIIAKLVKEKAATRDWRNVEYDLNVQMRATVDAKKRKLINDELTAKFGSMAIGTSDETIVKTVLKRGSISTNAEGQRIRDLLSDLPEELMSDEDETKLSSIYAKWEQGK
jgi:hypothetical protein